MISQRLLQCVLFLGICIAVAISGVSAEYPFVTYRYSSRSGKGKGKGGRNDYITSWNEDPDEDNVDSPPVAPVTEEPSFAPTGTPNEAPSVLPSTTPSVSPSSSPTTEPSLLPSDTPTVSQVPTISPSSSPTVSSAPSLSHAPTISTAPSQSAAPSQSHAPSISTAPSQSASPTTTPVPTESASPSTSFAPTVAKCTTNDAGFYGDSSSNDMVISFGYELEYETGYNSSDVISSLENSFNDFLLPFLFPSDCPTNDERRVLFSVHRRRLETIGVSKRPDDVPIDGVTCAQTSDQANKCVVVDGALTVYTTPDGTPTQSEEEIRNQIKQGMEDGDFEKEPIVRVSYVDLEANPNPNRNDGDDDPVTQGRNGRNRVVFGVVAAVASLLLLALAVVWRRKKQHDESVLSANETATDIDGDAGDV